MDGSWLWVEAVLPYLEHRDTMERQPNSAAAFLRHCQRARREFEWSSPLLLPLPNGRTTRTGGAPAGSAGRLQHCWAAAPLCRGAPVENSSDVVIGASVLKRKRAGAQSGSAAAATCNDLQVQEFRKQTRVEASLLTGLPRNVAAAKTLAKKTFLVEYVASATAMAANGEAAQRWPAAAEASVGLSSGRRGGTPEELDDTTHLLFYASQGDVDGLAEVLRRGGDVNLADYDGRTALHLAASEGQLPALRLLLAHGAAINPTDRWGSTPLSDARHYDHLDAVKLLEAAGGKMGPLSRAPSPPVGQGVAVQGGGLPPPLEYEIDVSELDFSKSKPVGKGAFGEIHVVNWRGTRVAVKTILSTLSSQPQIVKEFREELTLLQKLRHPNIVQFLGAVTQTMPLMIVTEYLPKGDVAEYVRRKGALEASTAVSFALDIARGMNYLHEHRPDAIVHRDLKPRNLLRDDAGHLKVADFGLGKLLKAKADSIQEVYQMTGETGSYRYMAPEVFRHEAYHKSVDVFSFAIIVQEFFEGKQAFKFQLPEEIAQAIAFENLRPPFKARTYPPGMKGLLQECWNKDPKRRPTFTQILEQLELMERKLPPPADVIQQGCNCTVL
eukprot:SM000146S00936  [mRNA]  locus=s146:40295:48175:+ [translate_table: standard]